MSHSRATLIRVNMKIRDLFRRFGRKNRSGPAYVKEQQEEGTSRLSVVTVSAAGNQRMSSTERAQSNSLTMPVQWTSSTGLTNFLTVAPTVQPPQEAASSPPQMNGPVGTSAPPALGAARSDHSQPPRPPTTNLQLYTVSELPQGIKSGDGLIHLLVEEPNPRVQDLASKIRFVEPSHLKDSKVLSRIAAHTANGILYFFPNLRRSDLDLYIKYHKVGEDAWLDEEVRKNKTLENLRRLADAHSFGMNIEDVGFADFAIDTLAQELGFGYYGSLDAIERVFEFSGDSEGLRKLHHRIKKIRISTNAIQSGQVGLEKMILDAVPDRRREVSVVSVDASRADNRCVFHSHGKGECYLERNRERIQKDREEGYHSKQEELREISGNPLNEKEVAWAANTKEITNMPKPAVESDRPPSSLPQPIPLPAIVTTPCDLKANEELPEREKNRYKDLPECLKIKPPLVSQTIELGEKLLQEESEPENEGSEPASSTGSCFSPSELKIPGAYPVLH